MKKVLLLLALVFVAIDCSAFKIEKDEVDEFDGTRLIATSKEKIGEWRVRICGHGENVWLHITLKTRRQINIHERDELKIKTHDGSIYTLYALDTDILGRYYAGVYTSESNFGIFDGLEHIAENGMQVARLTHKLAGGYDNFTFTAEESQKLSDLIKFFLAHRDGEPQEKMITCALIYLKKRVNAKSWDIVKEEHKDATTKSRLDILINEWKAKSNEEYIFDVQIKKPKK